MLSKTILGFVFLFILLIPMSSVIAGSNTHGFGIGLSVIEESPRFMARFWIKDRVSVNPEFSLSQTSKYGGGYSSNFAQGLRVFYHFRPGSEFRPFAGIGIVFDVLHFSGKNYADIFLGISFGGEYFFSNHFSVQGEYRIEMVATDEEFSPNWLGNDVTHIYTKQALGVHFYF